MISRPEIAAILVDLQNGFIGPDSPFQLKGIDQLLENTATLVHALRGARAQIFWTRVYLDEWHHSPYSEQWPQHFDASGATFLAKDSTSHALQKDIEQLVMPEDVIVDKPRYSAFLSTTLEAQLHELGVTHLIFGGVTTNVCVETTIRDAFQRNFYCTLCRDCSLTFNTALQACAEEVISFVFGKVDTLDNIVRMLMDRGHEVANS